MEDIAEEDIWYPDINLVLKIHDEMLSEFGGFSGFETGVNVFKVILNEVKKERGIYRKAAVLLKRIIEVRIFCDGNHRTAYGVTDVFLRENGVKIKIEKQQKIIRFIREIRQYDIDEIEAWLKDGKIP